MKKYVLFLLLISIIFISGCENLLDTMKEKISTYSSYECKVIQDGFNGIIKIDKLQQKAFYQISTPIIEDDETKVIDRTTYIWPKNERFAVLNLDKNNPGPYYYDLENENALIRDSDLINLASRLIQDAENNGYIIKEDRYLIQPTNKEVDAILFYESEGSVEPEAVIDANTYLPIKTVETPYFLDCQVNKKFNENELDPPAGIEILPR